MKLRYFLVIFIMLLAIDVSAQTRITRRPNIHANDTVSHFVHTYTDSLFRIRQQLDSLYNDSIYEDIHMEGAYYRLFTPTTYYSDVVSRQLGASVNSGEKESVEQSVLDDAMLSLYLHRPDLVMSRESQLDILGPTLDIQPKAVRPKDDFVERVAPKAIEPTVDAVNVLVRRPNFWAYGGDFYLQFLQNYVSGNWSGGGQSNYTMLGNVTLRANYNNHKRMKFENTLEMKLGFQTTKSDTIHSMKTSQDMWRYTGTLGLQATRKWYYTFQMILNSQFMKGYNNNNRMVYSDIFSPITLNLSLGMDYGVDWLKSRLTGNIHLAPIAYNNKYVGRESLATTFGIDEGKRHKEDYGSEISINLTWKPTSTFTWTSRIHGYTTYKRSEMEFENTINFKFSKYLSSNFYFYPKFDDDVARDDHHGYWQFREYLSFGLSYSL